MSVARWEGTLRLLFSYFADILPSFLLKRATMLWVGRFSLGIPTSGGDATLSSIQNLQNLLLEGATLLPVGKCINDISYYRKRRGSE